MAGSQKTVLIVEDEPAMRRALADALGSVDIATLEAGDGEEGLQVALKDHPDLILLDILMPKMDGINMMKKLRDDVWGKKAKIVILTNFDTDDKMLGSVVKYEPSYYLIKANWDITSVVAKVRETLGLPIAP